MWYKYGVYLRTVLQEILACSLMIVWTWTNCILSQVQVLDMRDNYALPGCVDKVLLAGRSDGCCCQSSRLKFQARKKIPCEPKRQEQPTQSDGEAQAGSLVLPSGRTTHGRCELTEDITSVDLTNNTSTSRQNGTSTAAPRAAIEASERLYNP